MPKAPPRRPRLPDPPGRRVYAHLTAGQFACPRCERLVTFGGRAERLGQGYDRGRALYHCPCGYRAVLGVVFWPLGPHDRDTGRPADHVPTPAEASTLRALASYEGPRTRPPEGGTRARTTNVECTCGQPCRVHGARAPELEVWDDAE